MTAVLMALFCWSLTRQQADCLVPTSEGARWDGLAWVSCKLLSCEQLARTLLPVGCELCYEQLTSALPPVGRPESTSWLDRHLDRPGLRPRRSVGPHLTTHYRLLVGLQIQ